MEALYAQKPVKQKSDRTQLLARILIKNISTNNRNFQQVKMSTVFTIIIKYLNEILYKLK